MDEIQLTTLIIALYGALLSTILAVYKFYENWKRLKVELSYGIISDEPQIRDVLTLSCSNLGKRPITLTSYAFPCPIRDTYSLKMSLLKNFLARYRMGKVAHYLLVQKE